MVIAIPHNRNKLVFILEKKTGDDKFQKVLMEVKKGLFKELFEELPEEIKALIDIYNIWRKEQENMAYLKKVVEDIESGKVVLSEHELIKE